MKSYIKLFFVFIFLAVSAVGSAQSFSVAELLDLSAKDNQSVNTAATAKGYVYAGATGSDLSTNYVFDYGQNAKLYLIAPNFASDIKLLGWVFYSAAIYDSMKSDILANDYHLVNIESRHKGNYVSRYYSKAGIDIILTFDKTVASAGVYRVAVRSLNMDKYANNFGENSYPVMEDYLDSPKVVDKTPNTVRKKTPNNPNFEDDMNRYLEMSKYLNK